MSQITTPAQLKAAYPYRFAQPMDTWAFAFTRGWFATIARACEDIDALVKFKPIPVLTVLIGQVLVVNAVEPAHHAQRPRQVIGTSSTARCPQHAAVKSQPLYAENTHGNQDQGHH
jgi:hypothetical protein